MTKRSITLKKIDNSNTTQDINDNEVAVVELFYTAKALLAYLENSKTALSDKRFEMTHTKERKNLHAIMKQVRQHQRNNKIYFSQNNADTHYVYAHRKVKITRDNDKAHTSNILRIFHVHALKALENYDELRAQIAKL